MKADFATLAALPDWMLARCPRPAAIRRCRDGGFVEWSTAELVAEIRALSATLDALGAQPGDRVALISGSRPEWLIADLAIFGAGAVTVPIYPTLAPQQARFILHDAGARLAIVSDAAQLAKLHEVRAQLPDLLALIVIDNDTPASSGKRELTDPSPQGAPDTPPPSEERTQTDLSHQAPLDTPPLPGERGPGGEGALRVVRWTDALARGRQILDRDPAAVARLDTRRAAVTPDALATVVYTSGTTGDPKGVMLTHHNLVANIDGCHGAMDKSPADVALSFLPLSHSFERTVVYSHLADGVQVAFAESIDTLPRDLSAVRPTLMTAVPRVFEKMHARILERVAEGSAIRRRLFAWAIDVGLARVAREQRAQHEQGERGEQGASHAGQAASPPPVARSLADRLADRLVYAKIRARTGGRLRCIVSGSAPLPVPIAQFFAAVGMPISEGYGLTEAAPVLTVNRLGALRIGTVGQALHNVELRIAEDGEVLARGPNVMPGYWQRPEETAAALDGAWLRTGDVGTLSADGYLAITDRKKDLIVTSGGKKLAPQPLEARLKAASPLVAEAIVIGDGRRFPCALFVPDFGALQARLAAMGRPPGTPEELIAREDVRALFEELVTTLNRELAQFEQIKKIALLPVELSVMGGELTPTLKVRRRVIEERWSDVIERLYAR